jgi:hypothetical protein
MSNRLAALEVSMSRSALSLSILTAAVVAGLASAPRVAAQSAPTAAQPAVAESELGTSDAANMRLLVDSEAQHRDRLARIARLRTLAQERGQTDRIADLDRLTQIESDHFEARSLIARSRMSDVAVQQADNFVRHGGTMKMRRANQTSGHEADRGHSGHDAQSMRAQKARRSQATTTRPGKSVNLGTSTRRTGSTGGRSPR